MHKILRNGHLNVQWEDGAQLILSHPHDETTRVAGGLLLEMAPPAGSRRPRTVGVGFPETGDAGYGEREPERFSDAHGAGMMLTRSYPVAVQPVYVDWTVRLYDTHNFARIDMALRNVGATPLTVRRVFPFVTGEWWRNGSLRLEERASDFAVYKNGWQSWSYAGGLPSGHADPRPWNATMAAWNSPGGRRPRQPVSGAVDVVSEGVTMIGHPAQATALLAGFLSQRDWIGQVYTQRKEGAVAAAVLTDDCVLDPGATLTTPPLILALGDQQTLLPMYAEAVAREHQARRLASAPSGWCSWYYYFTGVTEGAMRENLDALNTLRESVPVDLVQLDDGYQTAVGDWLSINKKFRHGLRHVAEQIRERGFRPGLWLAPFTVAANSRLAKEHPDWLVHDARGQLVHSGKNWHVLLYGLDTSHPEAQAWLRTVFSTIVRDWGFDYLKLDFLATAALQGQRHDHAVTRARALRQGLQLIRDTVGDDIFLLGCGCPLLGAVGIVDAMRIGPDSAPHWKLRYKGVPVPLSEGHALPHMEGAVRNTLTRAWMSPALWINDPDCLLLREQRSELSADEVQSVATAVGLTGGMVLLSDRVSKLTPAQREIAARLLPPMTERALPLNNFTFGVPQRVSVTIHRPWGEWLLLGIFNADNKGRDHVVTWSEVGLAPGAYHAVEFWSGDYRGLSKTGTSVHIGGHSAAVLAIRAASDEPQLLSTSYHISQGAVEIADWSYDRGAGVLRWHAQLGRRAAGRFLLWLPSSVRPGRLTSTATAAEWHVSADGTVVVSAEIAGDAEFTLALESSI